MLFRRIAAFLASFAIVASPLVLQAAGMPDRIVPASCDGPNCSICDLATLAQNLINAGIFIAVFLSAILFAYAGWLYLSNEAIGEVERAKKIFLDVVLGLVLIVGAWLLVDTLLRVLLGASFLPWNKLC